MKASIDMAIGTMTAIGGFMLALLGAFAIIHGAQFAPMSVLIFGGILGMAIGIAVCVVTYDGR